MPKTPDDVKKGLECCGKGFTWDETCGTGCPYQGRYITGCSVEISADALALIQQLQAENAEKDARIQQLEERCKHMNDLRDAAADRALKMEERVHQLEAERDALMDHVYGSCVTCKHVDKVDTDYPCSECLCKGKTLWEWRGIQKEE